MSATKNNRNAENRSHTDESSSASLPGTGRNPLENLDDMVQDVMQLSLRAVDSVSEADAQARVEELRQQHPQATQAQLASLLIQKKCVQAGTVGAVTSGASVIPGLGSIAALTVGAVADLGMTMKLQAELVLEMAALYGHEFAPQEKRQAILMAAGIGAGAERLMARYGAELAEEVGERFAGRTLVKAVPLVGVAASAGLNVLVTYVVGQRAQAYFQLGPEAVGDWAAHIRALTGVDERAVGQWLAQSAAQSWRSIRGGTTALGGKLGDAARASAANLRRLRRRNRAPQIDDTAAVEIPIIGVDDAHPATHAPSAADTDSAA